MKKRLICVLLCLIMTASLLPMGAWANEGGSGGEDSETGNTSAARSAAVSKNVFLGNDKMELGINEYGSFGTTVTAPDGFHPWSNGGGYIGLISAPWSKSRDYFLPGTVDEGFVFYWGESQKARVQSTSRGGVTITASGDYVVGKNGTANESSGDTLSATTEATVRGVLKYSQNISFKDDEGYATVTVTVQNTSEDTLSGVEYVRGFDPDQGDSASTSNYYHTDSDGTVWIIATPTPKTGSYANPETFVEGATAPFIFAAPKGSDYTVTPQHQSVGWSSYDSFEEVTAESSGYKLNESVYADEGIGLKFSCGDLAAGETVTIVYYMSLDTDVSRAIGAIEGAVSGNVDDSAAGDFKGASAEGFDGVIAKLKGDNEGQNIDVKLIVSEKTAETASGAGEIAAELGTDKEIAFVDMTLTAKIGTAEPADIGDSNTTLLTITLPFDSSDKQNIALYRFHDADNDEIVDDGEVAELGQGSDKANDAGEYCVVGDEAITVYAKKFSTYAIAYTIVPTTYTVTVQSGGNGSAAADHTTAAAGTQIILTATPDSGYRFKEWQVIPGGVTVTDGKFTMPAANVTVKAVFEVIPSSPPIYIPPYVPPVHSCESICDVCGGCGDAECTEKVCEDKCILLDMDFDDVEEGRWYSEGVEYVYHHGIMNGVDYGRFQVEGTLTRAMMVTILWRLEGEPLVDYDMSFEDVSPTAWYGEAVRWAASEGIVTGYSEREFRTLSPITNEQFAAILWRYAKYRDYDVSADCGDIYRYRDVYSISDYAFTAMEWALDHGVMKVSGTYLKPNTDTMRGEAANLLMGFCENIRVE